MVFNIGLIAVTIMHIQIVQSQNDITFNTDSVLPYWCSRTLQLKCTYLGNSQCCNISNRIWTVSGKEVMTNGIEDPAVGKYSEGLIYNPGKYFKLIINNLEFDDFEKTYTCRYGFQQLLSAVTLDESCQCWDCGSRSYGYLNCTFVLYIIAFIVDVKCYKDWKNMLAALTISVILNQLLKGVIAGTVGIYYCLCLDKKDPWMILLGVATDMIGIGVAYYIHKNYNIARYLRLLIFLGLVTIVIDVIVLALIGEHLIGRCLRCGGRSYGWAAIGSFFAFVVDFTIIVRVKKVTLSRSAIFSLVIFLMSLMVNAIVAVPIGIYLCPCYDWTHPAFIALGVLYSLIILTAVWSLLDNITDEDIKWLCGILLSLGTFFLCFLCIGKKYFEAYIETMKVMFGSDVQLKSPYKKDASGQIAWIKLNGNIRETYSEGTTINQDLPKNLRDRLKVEGQDLCVSNVQESDAGDYECVFTPKPDKEPQGSKVKLIVSGENSQSVESGSSCWPICRVGQDPNTSSSDPEKVRRSSKKESADKKPTGFVRPQPSRAQHLGTDNTGRAEYSAENEMYSEKLLKSNKPRLLPSIGQQTDSPRPLPQMPASAQQGGNQLAPLEKKKKKRKKKREAKQSDEENSTEL